jgi:hypothetical protein
MPVWKWKVKFVDVRVCTVEADTEEEARRKMDEGNWASEDTVDFYSDDLLEDLSGPHDE